MMERDFGRLIQVKEEALVAGQIGALGSFKASAVEPQGDPQRPEFHLFYRCTRGTFALSLAAGQAVLLGPAVDLMRCRALPGERELRAFVCVIDGVLEVEEGVWFSTGQDWDDVRLESRDYDAIFNMRFAPSRELAGELPQGLSHDVVRATQPPGESYPG